MIKRQSSVGLIGPSLLCFLFLLLSFFVLPVADLLTIDGEIASLPESASLLEELLYEFYTSLTHEILSVPSPNVTKDSVQSAAVFANSRDGSGVNATHVATVPPIENEAILFALRRFPHYQQQAKEIMATHELEANSNTNPTNTNASTKK